MALYTYPSDGYAAHCEAKANRYRILLLRIALIPNTAAHTDQNSRDEELNEEALPIGQVADHEGHTGTPGGHLVGQHIFGQRCNQQAVANKASKYLGHNIVNGHEPRYLLVHQAGQRHGGIDMGARHTAEALDGDEHGETKREWGLERGITDRRWMCAAQAADVNQDGCAEQLSKEFRNILEHLIPARDRWIE